MWGEDVGPGQELIQAMEGRLRFLSSLERQLPVVTSGVFFGMLQPSDLDCVGPRWPLAFPRFCLYTRVPGPCCGKY